MSFKKVLKKSFIILIGVLFIGLISSIIYINHIKSRALPDYIESVKLGLSNTVEIYRDSFAVPHVYASNEFDLYKSVGYLTAQDRLWQMDLLRRVTQGRISEIVGDKAIKFDLLMRSLQLNKKSEGIIEQSSDTLITILEAYAEGVNQYIADNKDNLPQEFSILGYTPEKWEIKHSLNLIGYMAWDLTPNYKAELILEKIRRKIGDSLAQEFVPETSTETFIYPHFKLKDTTSLAWHNVLEEYDKIINELGLTVFSGSNNWAVSSKKSNTGKALLANDIHLKLGLPGIWYQIHEVIEGELNVTGLLLPGQPFIVSGHNEKVAWGLTNLRVDNIDFYQEKISKEDTTKYEFNNELLNITFQKEVIKSKGVEHHHTIRRTMRGPIISDWTAVGSENTISMKWVGSHQFSNEVKGLYLFNHAKNWTDFSEGVANFGAVAQNINYADVEGNIGLRVGAGIPIRKKGTGHFVAPGWTDEYDWKGYVPFDSLPYTYNPSSNIVSSANNKTVNDDYPYYINRWFCTPYRAERIVQVLNSKPKVSIEDFKALQNDYYSILAKQLSPVIIEHTKNTSLTELEKEGIQLLENWDYVLNKESPEALVFENFCVSFLEKVIKDELGEELFKDFSSNAAITPIMIHKLWRSPNLKLFDDVSTDVVENYSVCIEKAYKEAIRNIKERYGVDTNNWMWGKEHTLTLKHPLGKNKLLDLVFNYNSEKYPVGGSFHTVSPFFSNYNNYKEVDHGASHRQVYTVGDWDNSYSVLPSGNSGLTTSKHYLDQLELFINGEYHRDYFSRKKVEENTLYKTTFK